MAFSAPPLGEKKTAASVGSVSYTHLDVYKRQLYILQARPETVKSRQKKADVQQKFVLLGKGEVLVTGRAIGQKIGAGKVRIVAGPEQMDLSLIHI